MTPIPELTALDIAFGNIKHLPPMKDIPPEFKRMSNPYCKFVSGWFFNGRTKDDMAKLTPRNGVDRNAALRAIQAALGSWEPAHEHKEAGCAFLLHEWFELQESK